MSRHFTQVAWCLISLLSIQAPHARADDSREEIRAVLRAANAPQKSLATIGVETAERYRAAIEREPLPARVRYAYGLALAKGGKYAEATDALAKSFDELDDDLKLGALAVMGYTKAAQKSYASAGQHFEQLADLIRAGRDQIDPDHLRELADFSGQTLGFLECLDEGEAVGLVRIKSRLRDAFPDSASEVFERSAQQVQEEYGRLEKQLFDLQRSLQDEQQEKQENLKKALTDAKGQLVEEKEALKKSAEQERERLESAREQLNKELLAVEREYQSVTNLLLNANAEIRRLERERSLYFRTRRLENGQEVTEVLNPAAVNQIDRELDRQRRQLNMWEIQQQSLLVQGRRLLAQGAQVEGQGLQFSAALKSQQDSLQKQASKLKKREQVANLAKSKDETTKTKTLRNKMRTLSTYVQVPLVSEGKRLLAE